MRISLFKLSKSISAKLHLFEQKMLKKKSIQLSYIYDPAILKLLVGDPMRSRPVILNLRSNALKFTSKGKISLNILLVSEDRKSIAIEFLITDTGIGIAQDNFEQIFKNFK